MRLCGLVIAVAIGCGTTGSQRAFSIDIQASAGGPLSLTAIGGTLQLAAGMNLHVFTTGRGTPYGLAECPVIKVATRSDLARRWHDLMDINAGRIADGDATIDQALHETHPE